MGKTWRMKLLRKLYGKRGIGDPAGAMVADSLLLAAVAVAAPKCAMLQ